MQPELPGSDRDREPHSIPSLPSADALEVFRSDRQIPSEASGNCEPRVDAGAVPTTLELAGGETRGSAVQVAASTRLTLALPVGPRPPGPGFWESIGWLVGVLFVQACAALAATVALTAVHLIAHPLPGGNGEFNPLAFAREVGPFIERELAVIIGAAGMATVLYGAIGVSVRLRKQGGLAGLGLQLPSIGQILLIALGMLPLSILCTELQNRLFGAMPHAENEFSRFFTQLADAPLWQLLWGIALAPALGEELLFRGLIGRGLIARRGVLRGMILTSILFGIVHLNPGQALAVIPLGFAMHFTYLTTRSFWAPVILHLLNNGFAVLMLKFGDEWQIGRMIEAGGTPLPLLTVSAAMVTAIGLLLWQTRVRFVREDDGSQLPDPWAASGAAVDAPALAVTQSPQPLLLACGAFNSCGFVGVVWQLATGI